MRIVQIGGFHIGAQRTIEEAIHRYLQEHGDIGFIGYAYGESAESRTWRYTNSFESIITRGLRKVFGKRASLAKLQTVRLIQKLRKLKPDLIHLHVIHDGYIDYSLLFKFIIQQCIPTVYTMHDLWAVTGGCYHYTQLQCDGYQSGCKQCPAKEKQLDCEKVFVSKSYDIKKELLIRIPQLYSVAVSKWVSGEIHKSFLSDKPTYAIHNCIEQPDLKQIERYTPPQRKRKYRLVGIANIWDLSKGIDKMYEIARYLSTDYEILLVGSIADKFRIDTPDNIDFFGYCNSKVQVYSLLRDADLYISTSLEETFGMTFVEAAYVGTRSIGFDSTAIKEILMLTDGICVTDLSIVSMCNEIRNAIAKKKNKLTVEKVNSIRSYFSAERMSREYYQIYQSAINRKV